MDRPEIDCVIEGVIETHYRKPLLNNTHRADYVEVMIVQTLGEGWSLVSRERPWAPWDLERDDKVRLEVKQCAALQPWSGNIGAPNPNSPRYDIAHRKEPWTKGGEFPYYIPGRPADIYVFAWHPVKDLEIADHRIAEQWEFFVIPEYRLPIQNTISLGRLRLNSSTEETTYESLSATVATVADKLPGLKYHLLTPEIEWRLKGLEVETGLPVSSFLTEVLEKGIEDVEDYYRAHAVMERVLSGEEKVYSAAEVRAYLDLDC